MERGNCEAFECLSLQSEAIFSGGISRSKGRDIPIVRRVIKINHIVSLSVLYKTQLQAFNNIKLNISSGEK
ncbi:hypothetical protein Bca52824_071993 [Brassica carinata]|uniref:Uncharacterized protein n=1 Tax=Brassica carinata TaxID=52824 RepID=A0A8X7U4J1_BRACI|nr:hypothetical protein Bca52824_071993 [Brassica carinata]